MQDILQSRRIGRHLRGILDDFRLRLGKHELVPIMIGGMGVDISSADLALEAARLGGVGHISDAMIKTVADRRYKTKFVKAKQAMYKYNVENEDKSSVKFDLGHLAEATRLHVEGTMSRKPGGAGVHQLHGKADDERAQGDAQGAHERGAGCRHRRHHAGRRPAPRVRSR
jgi:NAD(P)H-dependent flavin oxidoreductase YrpB (nitropropane dioxygenase family)